MGQEIGRKNKGNRPATLADVARLAGVVPMTASRAINNTGYVSKDVRAKVLKAARKLHYRPNVLARQLKGKSLRAVGVVLADTANPFVSELVAGIREVLEADDYTVYMSASGGSVEHELRALHSFVDHRVDGILVTTWGTAEGDRALAGYARQQIPIVSVGRTGVPGVDSVTVDHRNGAKLMMRHLLDLGHHRIGYIGSFSRGDRVPLRVQGYKEALAEAGIPWREEYLVREVRAAGSASEQDGYEGMMELMRLKQRPTAVFARNDFAAIGALHAAQSLGLRVPADVAVAGFDNVRMAAYTSPPLTTVAQPILEQGRAGARMLLERIDALVKDKPRRVFMDCRLVVRESTAAAPGR